MISKMKLLSGLGLLALVSQGCSSNSAAIDGHAGIDAPATGIDAPANHIDANVVVNIDAAPGTPDAATGATLGACPGVTSGSAPANLTIAGVTESVGFSGPAPAGGIKVTAFSTTSATALASMTSADTTGDFSLSVATGGTSIDGYLLGQVSGSLDTYVFPPAELSASLAGVPVITIATTILGALGGLSGVTQDNTKGVTLVAVLDSSGNPVSGAVVTSSPASTVRYSGNNGTPSSSATSTNTDGVAYMLNATPGCVNVTASLSGHAFTTAIIHVFPSSTAISLTQVIETN